MKNQEKVIKLVNIIEKLFDYFDVDEVIMTSEYDEILDMFSDKLNEIFNDGLNEEILEMISKIEKTEIFYIDKNEKYRNNIIRKQIVEYLNNKPLYFDYNLIKKYIKENYKLAKYIKDEDKILELLELNERVILEMDCKYLTERLILKQMRKSSLVTEMFLGMHDKNNIYNYSMFYKNNKDINKILYEQSIEYLKKDIYKIVRSSELVKCNHDISRFILNNYPKFHIYMTDNLK